MKEVKLTHQSHIEIEGWFRHVPYFAAAFVARTLSIVGSFPFEYHATVLQGQASRATKINRQVNSNLSTGLGAFVLREYLFTMAFWPVAENTKSLLHSKFGITNHIVLQTTASVAAGLVAATISYPADMIKTLRISYEKDFSKLSNAEIFKNVYKEGG